LFDEKFVGILRDYPDSVTNRKKLVGLLRDFFPTDAKQTRLLINLHELAIAEEISKADSLNDKFAFRYVKQLIDEYGVTPENAVKSVRIWCTCYGEGILGKPCLINIGEDNFYAPHPPNEPNNISGTPQTDNADIGNTTGVLIPCGIGENDHGYYICGMIESMRCLHQYANVYAVIYNYIIRSTRNGIDDRPAFFKNMKTPFQINYTNVFRLETIILQLIKNNYITDSLVNFNYDGDVAELRSALMMINHYADLFCRLIGLPPSPPLRITSKAKTINISFLRKGGVYVESNTAPCNVRALWIGQKINYRLTESNLKDLQYILSEISTFHSFREGQFETLAKMLSSDEHVVCTMPTGRGKSLLFYMASLLQPVPVFVIAPTDNYIRSQIRNLEKIHNFDNTAILNNENIILQNALLFLSVDSISDVLPANLSESNHVSYAVLDDVHCLANRELELSYESVGDLAAGSLGAGAFAVIERLHSKDHQYSYSFDLLVFLTKLRFLQEFDHKRLERIMTKTLKKDFLPLVNAVIKIYEFCTNDTRFDIHKQLGKHLENCGMPYSNLFDLIYLSVKKDIMYYGVLAAKCNRKFTTSKVEGAENV
jgi:hypothetical protein